MNGKLKSIAVKLIACLAIFALVPLGVQSAHAASPTVVDQVATYYANDGTHFSRSASPVTLPDGSGTVSQTANGDGTVTVTLSGVTGYGDAGFGVDAGTLADLNGVLIQGTGDDFGLNLYFDVNNDSEYFSWSGNNFVDVGSDKYILGPGSASGVLQVKGSTLFTSMNPGGGDYTLAQLKAGAAAGISGSTHVRLWVGTCCSALTTKSSTIQSIYISTGTISDYYVDGTFADGSAGGHIFGVDAFSKIQDAIDAAGSGATIHVAAGTYVEQLSVTKHLTLVGADAATTIVRAPDTLSACFSVSGSPRKAIICVENTDADVTNLTVDGAGKGNANASFLGIAYHNATGTVSGNTIIHVRNNPLDGSGNGVSIYGYNDDAAARTIDVTGNTTSDYGKNGMAFAGEALTANVTGNTVTGMGATGVLAQNGIQLGWAATGSVTGNTVTNNAWTGTYGGSNDPTTDPEADGAAAVLLYGAAAGVDIGGNTFTGNQFGVWSVAAPSLNVHDNTITGLSHTGSAFPTGIAIWSSDMWSEDLGFSDTATDAILGDNTLSGNDYGVVVRDFVAGSPSPSATASGNTFSNNGVQLASTAGTVTIATTLSGNTFDRAVTVDHGGSLLPFIWSRIQDGINAAVAADTVHAAAGTYIENITIDKTLTLAGADQATTIIKPAASNPNCGDDADGSSLCSGASNIILVKADDVVVHHFTLDGDNPGLTSGKVFGGADIDARNGLITDHTVGTFDGLEVHHVTVQNIFLRGMYASSGGTFNFHDNTVTNVQATASSIAMFAWGGPGTMQNNMVSYAQDAISANHSKGIQFLGNTVTNSGSGVHTDNAGDGGGVADLIQANNISSCNSSWGGYGIFVFVPYLAPTVNNNTVTGCQYGLSAWGQGAAVTSTFSNNTVSGPNKAAGSVGVYIGTGTFSWGYTDVTTSFSGNSISNNETGVYLDGDAQVGNPIAWAAKTIDTTFECNQISGNTAGVDKGSTGTYTNDFSNNWWGDASGPAPSGTGNSAATGINYTPWLQIQACPNTKIYVGGSLMGSYGIASGGRMTPQFNVLNGPVDVQGSTMLFASERVHNGTGFINEVLGVPTNQITNEYWFPWYDNLTMQTWILVGNPSTSDTAHVHIYIAGTDMNPAGYDIGPLDKITPTFPVLNGPVHIVSDKNVFASERVHTAQGFVQETMGYPNNRLTTEYWFPWYDNLSMSSWILVGNPSTTLTAHVHIYIAGTDMNPAGYDIGPGGRIIPTFPVLNGPVRIFSDKPVFTSERVHNSTGFVQETMGYPNNRLTTEYWFPWYDNLDTMEWILVGRP